MYAMDWNTYEITLRGRVISLDKTFKNSRELKFPIYYIIFFLLLTQQFFSFLFWHVQLQLAISIRYVTEQTKQWKDACPYHSHISSEFDELHNILSNIEEHPHKLHTKIDLASAL